MDHTFCRIKADALREYAERKAKVNPVDMQSSLMLDFCLFRSGCLFVPMSPLLCVTQKWTAIHVRFGFEIELSTSSIHDQEDAMRVQSDDWGGQILDAWNELYNGIPGKYVGSEPPKETASPKPAPQESEDKTGLDPYMESVESLNRAMNLPEIANAFKQVLGLQKKGDITSREYGELYDLFMLNMANLIKECRDLEYLNRTIRFARALLEKEIIIPADHEAILKLLKERMERR